MNDVGLLPYAECNSSGNEYRLTRPPNPILK